MTQEQILSRLLSDISDEFDKSVGSFFYDIDKPVAKEFETLYNRVEEILVQGFAATATGAYLDSKVLEQGLTRKPPTFASVTVKITGTPGSTISVNDKVASDLLVFSIIENKTVGANGTVTANAICDTAGSVGNVPIGAINHFPVTISGLVSVTNEAAAIDGFDEETDDELRDRYFEKVSLPATSGSKYHYIQWAKEVGGVGDAKCIPLWNGAGTVKVVIINSDRGAANQALINEVSAYIEENRPIGASVTVASATPLEIDVSVTLTLTSGTTNETALEKIEENITNYLKQKAFTSNYVSYAQIGRCILECDEVLDYEDLLVNEDTENIEIANTEVAVLGEVTINEDD